MNLPYNLTNGKPANADEVQANFDFLAQTKEVERYTHMSTSDQTFTESDQTIWGLSFSNNIKLTPKVSDRVKFEMSTLFIKDAKSYYLYLYLDYKINNGATTRVSMIPYTETGHLAYIDRHYIDVGVGNELSVQVVAKKQAGGDGACVVVLPSWAYKLVTLEEL